MRTTTIHLDVSRKLLIFGIGFRRNYYRITTLVEGRMEYLGGSRFSERQTLAQRGERRKHLAFLGLKSVHDDLDDSSLDEENEEYDHQNCFCTVK